MSVKIYHNPRCSKSRQALEILKEKNIEPEIIRYLEKGLEESEIKEILTLLNKSPREIMRKNEDDYKVNNLKDETLSDEALIKAICKFPKLLERSIVINDQKARIGRPPESILEII